MIWSCNIKPAIKSASLLILQNKHFLRLEALSLSSIGVSLTISMFCLKYFQNIASSTTIWHWKEARMLFLYSELQWIINEQTVGQNNNIKSLIMQKSLKKKRKWMWVTSRGEFQAIAIINPYGSLLFFGVVDAYHDDWSGYLYFLKCRWKEAKKIFHSYLTCQKHETYK